MANVLVFGHQNPDNDAIMSSVVLSQLLNQVEFDGNTYQACCLGPLPAESAKLLEDNGVAAPMLIDAIEPAVEGEEAQLVVLCDHNEPGQSVTGLENAVIAGVVDHHRFGNFTTAAPLHIVALRFLLLHRRQAVRGSWRRAHGRSGQAPALRYDDRHPHAQEPHRHRHRRRHR